MATKKNGKTVKASAKIKATASVKTDLTKIGNQNAKNAQKGVKQFYTDNGAELLIATLATVAGIKTMMPVKLRKATKNNAQARRQWCVDNKMPKVNWLTVQKIDGVKNGKATPADRPDNSVRARVHSLRKNIGNAKKVGYVRVLDAYTAKTNPTHPDSQAVYVYRIA
jgi:hypothetical protein